MLTVPLEIIVALRVKDGSEHPEIFVGDGVVTPTERTIEQTIIGGIACSRCITCSSIQPGS